MGGIQKGFLGGGPENILVPFTVLPPCSPSSIACSLNPLVPSLLFLIVLT